MKTFSEIYESIKNSFFKKSSLDVAPGTVIDSYMLASAEGISEAHKEIEKNKNPYIFTKMTGTALDDTGFFVNCPRQANETDEAYLYRMMNWTQKSEASNITAINMALMNMQYASYVTYVPLTEGAATATAYVIPKNYDQSTIDKAVAETKARLKGVVSPGSYINYVIPEVIPVKVIVYLGTDNGDINTIKESIKQKVSQYINGIPVSSYLEVGQINKIGINEPNVNYFNVVQLYINGKATTSLNILQKIESKFLFEDIIWWTAVE